MELRQTEQELSILVEQYKRISQQKLLGQNNNTCCTLPPWEELYDTDDTKKSSSECEKLTVTSNSSTSGNIDTLNNISNNILSVQELYESLVSIRNGQIHMEPKIIKFRSRLTMKDPITNAPRYGTKTIERVESLVKTYESLRKAVEYAFEPSHTFKTCTTSGSTSNDETNVKDSIIVTLEKMIKADQESKRKSEKEELTMKMKLQSEKEQYEKKLELELKRKEEIEQVQKQKEREELARRAEEARLQRIENERRAIEAEREADRAFLSSIEVGVEGVKKQLQVMREHSSQSEYNVGLRALHTIFKQISSRPEEIQFRRIRLDHPQFNEDIGRHCGGKELLVAAGFKFQQIDGKKCLFSAEPDLMTDMDEWSSWFDLIKATFQHLDDECAKLKKS
jgi:hypothetical protein